METPLVIGLVGAGMILTAFVALQFHYVTDEDVRYDVANAIGSIFLVYYAYMGGVWPFVILNTLWGLVSIRDVAFYYRKQQS
jgi:hypothetical protein